MASQHCSTLMEAYPEMEERLSKYVTSLRDTTDFGIASIIDPTVNIHTQFMMIAYALMRNHISGSMGKM